MSTIQRIRARAERLAGPTPNKRVWSRAEKDRALLLAIGDEAIAARDAVIVTLTAERDQAASDRELWIETTDRVSTALRRIILERNEARTAADALRVDCREHTASYAELAASIDDHNRICSLFAAAPDRSRVTLPRQAYTPFCEHGVLLSLTCLECSRRRRHDCPVCDKRGKQRFAPASLPASPASTSARDQGWVDGCVESGPEHSPSA